MVTQRARPVAEDFVEEIQATILKKFPDAEFTVYKKDRKNYRMDVVGSFDDMFDVLDLTSERVVDILVDHDIYIGITPIPRDRL
jgi:hypothetical protein